jgi:hypothetical protein
MVLGAGCGSSAASKHAASGSSSASPSSAAAQPKAKAVGLERIASAIGCKASVQTDSQELRQGNCATKKGPYVVVTFTTEAGKKAWLKGAEEYGGSYLVGTRWVVQAKPAALLPVQQELGGSFVAGVDHSAHSG